MLLKDKVKAFKEGLIDLVDLIPDPPKWDVPIRGRFLDSQKDKRGKKS